MHKLKFVNHLNTVINFETDDIYLDENSIRDYTWAYNALYDKIVNFKRGITTFKIPVKVISDNKFGVADKMFEAFEKDVLAKEPGKLWLGDSYMKGYIIAKSNKDYVYDKLIQMEMTFVTDYPFWIKAYNFIFRVGNTASAGTGLDYPYDYPYDYVSPISIQSFNNLSFNDSDFVMTIYGPINEPGITIGGNKYKVNTNVLNNEYLVINSKERTIVRTTARGIKINEFANRDNSEGEIFRKIPPGPNVVAMEAECSFDITILEERSEPEWS